jgi:hypothetical protein
MSAIMPGKDITDETVLSSQGGRHEGAWLNRGLTSHQSRRAVAYRDTAVCSPIRRARIRQTILSRLYAIGLLLNLATGANCLNQTMISPTTTRPNETEAPLPSSDSLLLVVGHLNLTNDLEFTSNPSMSPARLIEADEFIFENDATPVASPSTAMPIDLNSATELGLNATYETTTIVPEPLIGSGSPSDMGSGINGGSQPPIKRSKRPTISPSLAPISVSPTLRPTGTYTPSKVPSNPPSAFPSISAKPSIVPSLSPSMVPSCPPSELPSMVPTYTENMVEVAQFTQRFTLEGSKFFNESQILIFQSLMEHYTTIFYPGSFGKVNATCTISDQKSTIPPVVVASADPSSRFLRYRNTSRLHMLNSIHYRRRAQLEDTMFVNSVAYSITYTSDSLNVTSYPPMFEVFVNSNLTRVTEDLNALSLPVAETEQVSRVFFQTPTPTISLQPSFLPTHFPTLSSQPSLVPSTGPSFHPTANEPRPSVGPSLSPSPPATSLAIDMQRNITIVIVVVVVVVAILVMISLFLFYRKRKKMQHQRFQAPTTSIPGHRRPHSNDQGPMEGSWNAAVGKHVASNNSVGPTLERRAQFNPERKGSMPPEGFLSPSESLVSNQSLLSTGYSMTGDDSGDEEDATNHLQDEFDLYKDQNLEKMRADVEGNLTGFDGMMGQALTKALMDDEELDDPSELLWGGVGQQSGAEIEASALCDVTDWLKRNDGASMERT